MARRTTTPLELTAGRGRSRTAGPLPKATEPRPGRRCFTFFEASLVMGISMMILALVFAEISRFRTGSQRRACILNLKQIEAAKNLWALVNKKGNKKPKDAEILPYLSSGSMPTCPAGGTYNVRRVDTNPTCTLSKEGHDLRNINMDEDRKPD